MGTPKARSAAAYYYAGGKRIPLDPATDVIAVDDARLAAKLPDLLSSDPALRGGTPLSGGIRLVSRDALRPATSRQLEAAGVTQPVFRHEGTTLVALPEVRVEDGRAAKLAQVEKFAAGKVRQPDPADEGRLTLRPVSDDGRDALTLANELFEKVEPASVSPRFVRLMPRPGKR